MQLELWQNRSMDNPLTRRSWMAGAMWAASQSGGSAAETLRLPHPVRLALIGVEGHTSEILDTSKSYPMWS